MAAIVPASKARGRLAAGAVLLVMLVTAWQTVARDAPSYPGFVLAPPAGKSWVLVRADSRSRIWMRRQADPEHSFGAALLTDSAPPGLESPEDFRQWVKKVKRQNPDPERFRVVRVEVTVAESPAPGCQRYVTETEDRGTAGGMRFVVVGLACLHPDAPQRYFDVQYSERWPARSRVTSPRREGEAFLDGFRFTAPPADGRWELGPERAVDPAREAA